MTRILIGIVLACLAVAAALLVPNLSQKTGLSEAAREFLVAFDIGDPANVAMNHGTELFAAEHPGSELQKHMLHVRKIMGAFQAEEPFDVLVERVESLPTGERAGRIEVQAAYEKGRAIVRFRMRRKSGEGWRVDDYVLTPPPENRPKPPDEMARRMIAMVAEMWFAGRIEGFHGQMFTDQLAVTRPIAEMMRIRAGLLEGRGAHELEVGPVEKIGSNKRRVSAIATFETTKPIRFQLDIVWPGSRPYIEDFLVAEVTAPPPPK